jgi:hypothetical protein
LFGHTAIYTGLFGVFDQEGMEIRAGQISDVVEDVAYQNLFEDRFSIDQKDGKIVRIVFVDSGGDVRVYINRPMQNMGFAEIKLIGKIPI